MTLYSIQDTTLTSIGDALRRRHGEYLYFDSDEVAISKTANATGFDTYSGGYGNRQAIYDVVTIPDAAAIKVKMAYQTEGTSYDWVQVAAGNLTSMPSDAIKYGGRTLQTIELIFENTDTITFYFRSDTSSDSYLGYYAECVGLVPSLNTFKPEEMAAAIDSIEYFSDEDLVFTGNCDSLFSYDKWNRVLSQDGYRIRIDEATSLRYVFQGSTKIEDLNWLNITGKANNYGSMYGMFDACHNLKKLPSVSNFTMYTNQTGYIFSNCYCLNDTQGLINFFNGVKFNSGPPQTLALFNGCKSLRNIDPVMPYIKTAWETENSNNRIALGSMFAGCSSLNEVNNLYINTNVAVTSNTLDSVVSYCFRLKNLTFETNEDGTPLVWQAKSQTLSFTSSVGYYGNGVNYRNQILDYNSGITADKEVTNDATYQALKNDPDWFASSEVYSRYNHDSAVNTINSLPDTSAYLAANGGTNTIKFIGAAGSATDGGAINTLTEEEIAVATAKGWTVTLS